MAAVDLDVIWTTETNLHLGFASIEDLMLGDAIISKNIDLTQILDEAWTEIEAMLGVRYTVPLHPSDVLPHHTVQFLTRLHAYLATSLVVMSQGGASESSVNYARYLRDRFDDLIMRVVEGTVSLDGLESKSNRTDSRNYGPAVFLQDTKGAFATFEDYVHSDAGGMPWSRDVWRPGHEWHDPND